MTKDGRPKPCIPDPILGHCVRPYRSHRQLFLGGPHGHRHSVADVNGGRMCAPAPVRNLLSCGAGYTPQSSSDGGSPIMAMRTRASLYGWLWALTLPMGMRRRPVGLSSAPTMTASGAPSTHLQVYAPRSPPVLCVEPCSHLPDAPNRPDLEPLGPMRELAPGEILTGRIRLAITSR